MALTVGARVGPYRVLSLLGKGGMGEVYRAQDDRLGREVAIKVLLPGYALDVDRLRRFDQEARAAAALNHPNILAVYDIGTYDGAPYIVSELLQGRTLRAALDHGALVTRKAVDHAIAIANGLAAAHEKRHRPSRHQARERLRHRRRPRQDSRFRPGEAARYRADVWRFDTASLNERPRRVILGTAGYMSPEQVRGETGRSPQRHLQPRARCCTRW